MYPLDLDERIKQYLRDNKEGWDKSKHHIKIKENSKLLVIDDWRYKCKPLTPAQLNIPKLKILLIKNGR